MRSPQRWGDSPIDTQTSVYRKSHPLTAASASILRQSDTRSGLSGDSPRLVDTSLSGPALFGTCQADIHAHLRGTYHPEYFAAFSSAASCRRKPISCGVKLSHIVHVA